MKIKEPVNRFLTQGKRKADLKRILGTIDLEKFSYYQKKYKDSSPFPGYSKYLDIEKWIEIILAEVYRLKLNKLSGLDILDVGTGAGYFPYICNFYGHKTLAIDMDNVNMYNDIIRFLKIQRIEHQIKPFEKLPDLGKKFDMITGFSVCFNNNDRPDLWKVKEWDFFLKDLAVNYAKENCKALFVLTKEKNNKYYDDNLLDFFLQNDAKVDRARVYFKNLDIFKS